MMLTFLAYCILFCIVYFEKFYAGSRTVKIFLQLPDVFFSCMGVASSPGNLVVATVCYSFPQSFYLPSACVSFSYTFKFLLKFSPNHPSVFSDFSELCSQETL